MRSADLKPVYLEVGPEERLLHKGVVYEVPIVLMLSVLVSDAGEEPAGFAGQAMTKRGGLKKASSASTVPSWIEKVP